MDTHLYFQIRGTYEERKNVITDKSREWLEAAILDEGYNRFLRNESDSSDDENDIHGTGKRVPYIGWFWRHIEFSDLLHIPIGDCGDFIGFMVNNKWDYPERCLTGDEARKAIAIIDEAMKRSEDGGCLDDIVRSTNEKLDELWEYLQTLKV